MPLSSYICLHLSWLGICKHLATNSLTAWITFLIQLELELWQHLPKAFCIHQQYPLLPIDPGLSSSQSHSKLASGSAVAALSDDPVVSMGTSGIREHAHPQTWAESAHALWGRDASKLP